MFLSKRKAAGLAVLVFVAGAAGVAYQATREMAAGVQPAPTPSPKVVQGPATPSNDVTDWVAGWPDLTAPPDNNPKTKAILEALEKPIAMHFATDTPLADVIRYVRQATEGPGLPKGITIYVDPRGLQDADKTLTDTVTIQLEEVPLKITLDLLLKQLDLYYRVKDGLMIISSTVSDDLVTPLTIMREKAERGELTREQYKQFVEALRLRKEAQNQPGPMSPPKVAQAPSTPANDVTDWVAGWPDLTSDNSPKSKVILEALEKPIAMHFPNDTPLADVINYIRKATEGPGLPNGITIYVDPRALRDADKALTDTVTIDLEDVPFKVTLDLLLKQLCLYYRIKDGLMIITSTQSDDIVTPLTIMQEKAERGELTREQYKQFNEALKLRREAQDLWDRGEGMVGAVDPPPW